MRYSKYKTRVVCASCDHVIGDDGGVGAMRPYSPCPECGNYPWGNRCVTHPRRVGRWLLTWYGRKLGWEPAPDPRDREAIDALLGEIR